MSKKSKIFGIGLGKTGTLSLAKAMKQLGYTSNHYPRTIDDINNYDFCNDIPIAWRFKFLDYVYPNSKFILTTRDIDSWIKSCNTYAKKKNKNAPLRILESRFMLFGITHYDEKIFRKVFEKYHKKVLKHFRNRPSDILVMDLTKGDGWEKLCKFLNKPIPDSSFPHRHKQFESKL